MVIIVKTKKTNKKEKNKGWNTHTYTQINTTKKTPEINTNALKPWSKEEKEAL